MGFYRAHVHTHGNPLEVCMVRREGHCPKVLLWMMEEFFHISHSLTDTDCDGHLILCYELMMEAEHHFRIKRGGGAGHRRPSSSAGNASPCLQDKLEDVAWNKPDSKTLECLVWSVYNGVLSLGPTPKLMGPESYNQVTRCLTSKVFRGLQVHCPTCGHQPNLMSHPQPECALSSLRHPQVGCWKSRRLPRPWTQLPIKLTLQRRELWEERWMKTQTHIRWHGCAIIKTLIVMKWSASGLCSTRSRMGEGWLQGILCIVCCPLGNGLLPHTLHPALPPQAT